jgi:hypothetical protein
MRGWWMCSQLSAYAHIPFRLIKHIIIIIIVHHICNVSASALQLPQSRKAIMTRISQRQPRDLETNVLVMTLWSQP